MDKKKLDIGNTGNMYVKATKSTENSKKPKSQTGGDLRSK